MGKQLGFTNETWLNGQVIEKKSVLFHAQYLDKVNEYKVLNQIKNLKQDILITPKDFFWENSLLISYFDYLDSYSTLENLAINEEILQLLCTKINNLHNLVINSNEVKKFDYKEFIDFFFSNIKIPLFDYVESYNKIKPICARLQVLEQVFSHNDLVPGNILYNPTTKEMVLIDYDYVMMNNKFFDLASFITETLNDDMVLIDRFIEICIENDLITSSELHILNACINYQDLLWTLWANWMFEQTHKEIFKDICIDKYNRLSNRKKF